MADVSRLRERRAGVAPHGQLHLSLRTVKTHVHNAFAKLGINARVQLAQHMRGSD
jgi:hypothetical protein